MLVVVMFAGWCTCTRKKENTLFQRFVLDTNFLTCVHDLSMTCARTQPHAHRYRTALVPLSLLKLVASVSTFFTLLKVPVSYMHTFKALMPLCSVVMSRIVLGEVGLSFQSLFHPFRSCCLDSNKAINSRFPSICKQINHCTE